MFFNNALTIFGSSLGTIRHSNPSIWAHHDQGHLGFEARLIEAREDLLGVVSFKVCVAVLLVVAFVHIGVQANLVPVVATYPSQLDRIPSDFEGAFFKENLLVLETLRIWSESSCIHFEISDSHGPVVQKQLTLSRHFPEIESYDRSSCIVVSLPQAELKFVFSLVDASISLVSLCLGQRDIYLKSIVVD